MTIQSESKSLPHQEWGTSTNTFIEWLTKQFKESIHKRLEQTPTTPKLAEDKVKHAQDNLVEAIHTTLSRQLKWYTDIESLVVRYDGKSMAELHPLESIEGETYKATSLPTTNIFGAVSMMNPFGALPTMNPVGALSTNVENISSPLIIPIDYKIYRSRYQSEVVASHLREKYAALFEACWAGDNQTIEKLCLPPKVGKHDKHAVYLQVVADIVPKDGLQQLYNTAQQFLGMGTGRWCFLSLSNRVLKYIPGVSTLAVAVMAKRWDTAKVIISIAKAQYEKPDAPRVNFNPFESSTWVSSGHWPFS
jgi:hypothetical protein